MIKPHFRAGDQRPPADGRLGGRGASTVAVAATAALGVVLALFAVSGSRVPVRDGEWVPYPPAPPRYGTGTFEPSWPSARHDGASEHRADVPFAAARKQSTRPRRTLRNPGPEPTVHPNPSGPQITAVAGSGAGYGHKVTIRGSRLGAARRVLFIGSERGRADARFVVWDDDHLIAAVPDLGPRRQDAVVAVLTDDGVAVSLPADAPSVDGRTAVAPRGSLCLVRRGDVFAGNDAPVVFVDGGAAARASRGGTMFVRRGGSLWGRGGGDCLVYCERGVVARSDASACDFVEVDAVNPCVVRSLFHYAGR